MADLTFTTRGVAEVLAAQEKLAEQMGKQKTAARALSEEYRANDAELRKLGRLAEQIYRETETEQQKYNRRLLEAKAALGDNADAVETLRKFETNLKIEYLKSVDANKTLLKQRADAAKDAIKEQESLKKKVDETKDASSGIGDALAAAFSPGKMAGYLAGFVSIQETTKLIGDELRAQQGMIDARQQTQLTVGESRNVLLRNLDPNKPGEVKRVMAATSRIAAATGVSETAINNAVAQAFSSTSGDADLSLAVTETAAKYLGDQPANIPRFAGTLADLTRVTGSKDPNVNLGLIRAVGAVSRVVDAGKQAATIPQALINTREFGGTARTAGALFGALSGGSADVEGATTATAEISLAAQLDELAKGKGAYKPSSLPLSGEQQGRLGRIMFLPDLDERIKFLQQNRDLAEMFLDKASFEKKAEGAIRQLLLDPSSQVAGDYNSNLAKIPGNAELSRIGGQTLGVFRQYNKLEPAAELDRTINSTVEQLQVRNGTKYLSTQQLENLRKIGLETGGSNFGATMNELVGRADGGGLVPVVDAEAIIRRRLNALEHPTETRAYAVGNAPMVSTQERAPTAEEQSAAAILREMLTTLQKIEANSQLQEQRQAQAELLRVQLQIANALSLGGFPVGAE